MPGLTDNDDLLDATNQLIVAVNDLTLATESGPGVTCAPDVTVNCGDAVTGGGPIIDPEEAEGQDPEGEGGPGGGGLPPGFEGTIEEYDEYKCNASNMLVDAYLDYISRWQANILSIAQNATVGFGFISALLFSGALLLALLPVAVVPILIAYVISLTLGTLGLSSILGLYKQWIIDHKGDVVCALYEAQTVADARAALITQLDPTGIEGFPNGFVEINVTNLFSNSVLNILFENYAPAENYAGSINCTTCGCEYSLEFYVDAPYSSAELGSGSLEVDGNPRTLSSVTSGNGNHYCLFGPTEGCCAFTLTVHTVAGTNVFWHNSENCAGQSQLSYGAAVVADQSITVGGQWAGWAAFSVDGPFTVSCTLAEVV